VKIPHLEARGFSSRLLKNPFGCHSEEPACRRQAEGDEESVFSWVLEQKQIPRFARNDKSNRFSTSC